MKGLHNNTRINAEKLMLCLHKQPLKEKKQILKECDLSSTQFHRLRKILSLMDINIIYIRYSVPAWVTGADVSVKTFYGLSQLQPFRQTDLVKDYGFKG